MGNVFVGSLVHIGSESWTDRSRLISLHVWHECQRILPFFITNCTSLRLARPLKTLEKLRSLEEKKKKKERNTRLIYLLRVNNYKYPPFDRTLNRAFNCFVYYLGQFSSLSLIKDSPFLDANKYSKRKKILYIYIFVRYFSRVDYKIKSVSLLKSNVKKYYPRIVSLHLHFVSSKALFKTSFNFSTSTFLFSFRSLKWKHI